MELASPGGMLHVSRLQPAKHVSHAMLCAAAQHPPSTSSPGPNKDRRGGRKGSLVGQSDHPPTHPSAQGSSG